MSGPSCYQTQKFIAPNGLEPYERSSLAYRWFPWIDFKEFNVRSGLEAAAPVVAGILRSWIAERGLISQDLAVVGFSQGTMLALDLLFHIPGIRAVVGYSGAFYPPQTHKPLQQSSSILLVHGDRDEGVPYTAFLEAEPKLKTIGLKPLMLSRKGLGHTIDREGIDVGGKFLVKSFSE